jgi:biotin synthase
VADLHARQDRQVALHAQGWELARMQFGGRAFVRGVVEVSNFCREDCGYCGMRRSNRRLERYRASHDELAGWIIHHRPAQLTDLNLQAGEDPRVVEELVLPLLRTLRQNTALGLSVGLGTLSPRVYPALREAGATVYILKFETATAAHYRQVQAPGTLNERIAHVRRLAQDGWSVSSGFIAGLPGQTTDDLLRNFELAAALPIKGCSVSPFIPGEDTSMAGEPAGDVELALNCIAALRRMRPGWVIPAVSALNLTGGDQPGSGYSRALRAGANLVTINLTPPSRRRNYVIYRRGRVYLDEDTVVSALADAGLSPSRTSLAEHWERQTVLADLAACR